MEEAWMLRDVGPVQAEAVVGLVNDRLRFGEHTTWLDSTLGRIAGLVTNGSRAMLVVLELAGDAGVHAGDPGAAEGTQGGYFLENGQEDSYADRDTIPLDSAARALAELVRSGSLDSRTHWIIDR